MEHTLSEAVRKLLCGRFLELGNLKEAARESGVSDSETARQILEQPKSRAYLRKLCASPPLPLRALVVTGLCRLAFGSANDAARLCMGDVAAEELKSLDLFEVSELKKDRNGGVEVKFFDRQRALEKLLECAGHDESEGAAGALLTALGAGGE